MLLPVKPDTFQRRLYPALQIYGGGMMIMTFASQVGDSSTTTASLMFSGFLGAVGLCGILLGIRWLEQYRDAARWCLVFWVLQVPVFALPWLSYSFSCGAIVPIALEFPFSLSITAPRFGMQFVARLVREGPVSYVGFNLIAAAACRYFLLEWRHVRREVTTATH